MKKEIIFVVEESLDGGFEAKAIGESIYTQGNSIEEMKENIMDSIKCHFDDEEEIHCIINFLSVSHEQKIVHTF